MRHRSTAIWFAAPLMLLLWALPGGLAVAEDTVPRITNDKLPVAGTGAPMARQNVTHIMVGKQLGHYKVGGLGNRIILRRELQALLKSRAGTARPSPHEVWITAASDAIWVNVRMIRLDCSDAGIYRVGIRVRHESAPQTLGFPLFLPAGEGAPRAGRASRLPLVLEGSVDGPASDPITLYQAAKTAREKYKQDVVAEVRIHNNLSIQSVLRTLDVLYRAGCIGVSVKSLRNLSSTAAAPHTMIRIVRHSGKRDAVLPAKPFKEERLPPVAPRATPWPISGANQPGALTMELEELPLPGEDKPRVVEDPTKPLPFFLRKGGVPTTETRLADSRIRGWGRYLGEELHAGITKREGRIAQQFVVRLRDLRKLSVAMTPVSKAFANAQSISTRSIRLYVLLSYLGQPVEVFEVELLFGRDRVMVAGLKQTPGQIPAGVTLMPEAVDPFAAGTPGRLRIWIEALMDSARRRGAAGVPLAPDAHVLAACPASRRGAVQQALGRRQADVARATQMIARSKFDRATVFVRDATAGVAIAGRWAGLIEIGLEPEEGQLRVNKLTPVR